MVGANSSQLIRPYTLGEVSPVGRLWHAASNSVGQSRQVPPGREARIRLLLRSLNLDAMCSGSESEAPPASIAGSEPIVSRTVFLDRLLDRRSSWSFPNRDAKSTRRLRVCGTPKSAHSTIDQVTEYSSRSTRNSPKIS